jgi:toxin-antitoxin system PIN domain toxin
MFVVDTNVLAYAADRDSPFHGSCHRLLEDARRQAGVWYLTWAICYEFLRVTTHPRVFRKPWTAKKAWSFVQALVASPSLGFLVPTDRHVAVASEVFRELPHLGGNLMHDAHTATLMREHGIKTIYTRDTDFHRFPFLDPRDPTA